MDAEAACILCNWANNVLWPYFGLGALGAGAAAAAAADFFGGGFFGGSGGGHSDDFGADETGPSGYYGPGDPWNEEHQREYEESQREYQEEWRRKRAIERDRQIREKREDFYSDPTYMNGVQWFQEWFDFEWDEYGTVPATGKA